LAGDSAGGIGGEGDAERETRGVIPEGGGAAELAVAALGYEGEEEGDERGRGGGGEGDAEREKREVIPEGRGAAELAVAALGYELLLCAGLSETPVLAACLALVRMRQGYRSDARQVRAP